jgi:hypothetical protein
MMLSNPGISAEIVEAHTYSQAYLKRHIIPLHYPQNIKTVRIRNVATQLGWPVIYVALTSCITDI